MNKFEEYLSMAKISDFIHRKELEEEKKKTDQTTSTTQPNQPSKPTQEKQNHIKEDVGVRSRGGREKWSWGEWEESVRDTG